MDNWGIRGAQCNRSSADLPVIEAKMEALVGAVAEGVGAPAIEVNGGGSSGLQYLGDTEPDAGPTPRGDLIHRLLVAANAGQLDRQVEIPPRIAVSPQHSCFSPTQTPFASNICHFLSVFT